MTRRLKAATRIAAAAVLLPAPALPQVPEATLHPLHVIPGAPPTGAYFLTEIVDVVMGPDGGLVIHDRTPEPRLLRFDSAGRFQGPVAREGAGPGEYLMVRDLGFHGDTLWITDPRQRRVTWFHDKEVVVRTWGDSAFVANPLGLLADGRVITPFSLSDRRYQPLIRERDGTVVAELPVLRKESTNRRIAVPFRDRPLNTVNPFHANTLKALAPDGSGAAWVERPRPEADTASSYRVLLWRDGRGLERRIGYDPLPLGVRERRWYEQVVEAFATQLSEQAGFPAREIRQAFADAYPEPAYALPVYQAELDDDGRVWLAVRSGPEGEDWVRLDGALHPDLRIRVPNGERVVEINDGRLVTVWTDAVDVPELRVYEIH